MADWMIDWVIDGTADWATDSRIDSAATGGFEVHLGGIATRILQIRGLGFSFPEQVRGWVGWRNFPINSGFPFLRTPDLLWERKALPSDLQEAG